MFDSFNYRIRTLTHASGITHGCFFLLENKLSLETSNDWEWPKPSWARPWLHT